HVPGNVRTLQRNLKIRKKRAGMYVTSRRKIIQKKNKALRVNFRWDNKDKPLFGYFNRVYYTDEAYYNAIHMYSYANYYEKGSLNFYSENDKDNDLLPTPKAPSKPRRRKNESTGNMAWVEKLKNWILTIEHPAQSPDLNLIEGLWNILLQRKILQQEWDKIPMEEVRARIMEMSWRCREIVRSGGLACKLKLW
ncbi:hypothetical protein K469DRAFT_701957, partial [Zopfia rhizophila CBS 207.26]